jgi:glycerophosphoryl diester phosphodiesterase
MTTIQLRRGDANWWASANPVLQMGEPGWDSTQKILKVGDGATSWADLPDIVDQDLFDTLYAAIDHNHDSDYAIVDHVHSDYVKSVNNELPDETGNVTITTGEGSGSAPDLIAEGFAKGLWHIAHRGGYLRYPENGIKGYYAAERQGFMLESDVRPTSDGHLVLMHNDTLDATTNLTGAVNGKTLAQVRAGLVDPVNPGLDYDRVPTWHELLELCHSTDSVCLVQNKEATATVRNKMIADITSRNMVNHVIVTSDSITDAAAFAAAGINIAYITGDTATNWQSLWDQGIKFAAINIVNFSTAQVTAIKNIGFKVIGWTTTTYAEATAAIAKGIHGLISDDPWHTAGMYNADSVLELDGGVPTHFAGRNCGDDTQAVKDISTYGFKWSGPKILQRRGSTSIPDVISVELGFAGKTLPTVRFSGRFLSGAAAQDRWFGIAWGLPSTPDQVFDDQPTTVGQSGYTFICRRTGELELWSKNGGVNTLMGSTVAPTPNPTTVVTGTSAWQELELRVTATQFTLENRTTAQSVTVTNSDWRGAGRLYLINRGTDFEFDMERLAFG